MYLKRVQRQDDIRIEPSIISQVILEGTSKARAQVMPTHQLRHAYRNVQISEMLTSIMRPTSICDCACMKMRK